MITQLLVLIILALPSTTSSGTSDVPWLLLDRSAPREYVEARVLFFQYANSDEFYRYFVARAKKLTYTNLDVHSAVENFRHCLRRGVVVPVLTDDDFYPREALGGWDGINIVENTKFVLSAERRAGHWLHEAGGHGCGFSHGHGNYNEHGNDRSFPYQVGYLFTKFLEGKR